METKDKIYSAIFTKNRSVVEKLAINVKNNGKTFETAFSYKRQEAEKEIVFKSTVVTYNDECAAFRYSLKEAEHYLHENSGSRKLVLLIANDYTEKNQLQLFQA